MAEYLKSQTSTAPLQSFVLTDGDLAKAAEAWKVDEERNIHSNRMAAIHFGVKLACLGYELVPPGTDDPANAVAGVALADEWLEVLTRMEHNRWVAEKLMAGESYGPRSKTPPRRPQICTWKAMADDEELKKDKDEGHPQSDMLIKLIKKAVSTLGGEMALSVYKSECADLFGDRSRA